MHKGQLRIHLHTGGRRRQLADSSADTQAEHRNPHQEMIETSKDGNAGSEG